MTLRGNIIVRVSLHVERVNFNSLEKKHEELLVLMITETNFVNLMFFNRLLTESQKREIKLWNVLNFAVFSGST